MGPAAVFSPADWGVLPFVFSVVNIYIVPVYDHFLLFSWYFLFRLHFSVHFHCASFRVMYLTTSTLVPHAYVGSYCITLVCVLFPAVSWLHLRVPPGSVFLTFSTDSSFPPI